MKKVALSNLKDDLSRFLRMAEKEEIVITMIGSITGWRMTHDFLSGLNQHGTV